MEHLDTLLKKKEEIEKELASYGEVKLGDALPLRYMQLGQQLTGVQEKILEVRDWYSLNVLETLQNETRILKYLTIVLIVLTTVLAFFTALLVAGVKLAV